jgi:hypothetical protein
MRGLRDISLGIAAALAIASLNVMPTLADEVAASPAQVVNEEKAVVPDAAPAVAKSAPEQASNARAEVAKPPPSPKAKQAQLPLPSARPITLAQRHWNCWWCVGERQFVLMLGVGF